VSHELRHRRSPCTYCAGCDDTRPDCRTPLEQFWIGGVFYVDGIRYDPTRPGVHLRPMFDAIPIDRCDSDCAYRHTPSDAEPDPDHHP
jgi:hypothetical protein